MTTKNHELVPLNFIPGVCPPSDATPSSVQQYVDAQNIRFVKGKPQKLGGWDVVTLNGQALSGIIRSIFGAQIAGKVQTLLGSSEGLYGLIGSDNQNITPFLTSSTAAANSLSTHYATLANNPITTVDGSSFIDVADSEATSYVVGDSYTLSGSSAVGGVPDTDINKTHTIKDVASGVITLKVATEATSSTSGGGASVVRSSGLLTVSSTAHGQANGDRVKFASAADTGGILAASINVESIIRNVAANSFDIMTNGGATSSVSGGGGSSTVYYKQITSGLENETSGQGYGMGKYGTGLYGTARLSSSGRRFPRIWSFDNFGENVVMTPGNQGSVYKWTGTHAAAPALLSGAPTDVDYAFVSDNILVTLRGNRITASDQGNIEEWTSSSTNKVYDDYIEGAGDLISHAPLAGHNLLFTRNQVYTFRYIDLPLVWNIRLLDNIGLAGQNARVVVKGVAYWMGLNNFYMYRGGNVEVIPSNVGPESTLLKYVFENINRSQLSKCFAWYNEKYDEIWFHYPSENSLEPDKIARYHVTERHWTPDTMDRTAAEYPAKRLQFPRLVDSYGNFYRHEVGHDDSGVAMAFSLTTPLRYYGTDNAQNVIIVPDSVQTEDTNITITSKSKSFPQSPNFKNTKNFTLAPDTEFKPVGIDGRFMQYVISGEALGQEWIMGQWFEGIQQSSRSS